MTNLIEWCEWNLEGLDITQLCFDYSLHITIWSQEQALSLIFETIIEFQSADGSILSLNPEESTTLLPLLHQPVATFCASSIGQSILRFFDGASITCAPHEQYEAWQILGSGSLKNASLLCSPDGGSPWAWVKMTREEILLTIGDELTLVMFGLECALNVEFNPAETERIFTDAEDAQASAKQYVFWQSKGLTVTGRVDDHEQETMWIHVESNKPLAPSLKDIQVRARYQIFRMRRRESAVD